MGILRSGILGNVRGKVSGVVASQWKDRNYVREFVKPANPNTAAQQTQRNKMADCVAFAKPLVGPVFNPLMDPFLKSMSGFNYFIKQNIAEFDGSPDFSLVVLTEGKLSPITNLACVYTTGTGGLAITWSKNNGNNGLDTDQVDWVVYDETTGLFYFSDAPVNRSVEADAQTISAGLTATDLHIWGVAYQLTGTVITLVSNTDYDAVTAP